MPTPVRLAALVAFALWGSTPGAAQDKPKREVSFACVWKVGETRAYERVKVRKDMRDGAPQGGSTSTTPFTVEVLRKTADGGHAVAWTWGRTAIESNVPVTPLMEKFANLGEGIRVEIELDAVGSVRRVLNSPAIKARFDTALEAVKSMLESANVGEERVTATLAKLGSAEMATAAAVREPQIFFMGSGGQFVVGEPIPYEDQLANPFGGEAFPTKARFILTKIDDARDLVHIDWNQEFEPKAARRILRETVSKLRGRELTDAETPKFSIVDRANWTLESNSAWPTQVQHVRTVDSGAAQRIDSLAFTYKPKKAPAPTRLPPR